MYVTQHAQVRSQQRGIDIDQAISLLNECGAKTYNKDGSLIRYLDKQARRKIQKKLGSTEAQAFLDKHSNVYCVESVEHARVITIGYRQQRFQKKGHRSRRK